MFSQIYEELIQNLDEAQSLLNGYQFRGFEDVRTSIEQNWFDNEKYLLGRVLTIVDGSFSDPIQRKAVKDLVHQVFGYATPNDKNYRLEEVIKIVRQVSNLTDSPKTPEDLERMGLITRIK